MKTEQQQSGLQLSPSATVAFNELIDYCLGDEINHYAECITDGEDVDNLADCELNEGHIHNIPNSIIEPHGHRCDARTGGGFLRC